MKLVKLQIPAPQPASHRQGVRAAVAELNPQGGLHAVIVKSAERLIKKLIALCASTRPVLPSRSTAGRQVTLLDF